MRQRTVIIGVGVAAFLAVAVATLPASLVVDHLPPDLRAEGVSGSAWSGAADSIRLRGVPLGALTWSLEPGRLLVGELSFHVEVTRSDGFLRGSLAATAGGALAGRDLTLELPLTTLHPGDPGDWQGRVAGAIESARLERGWPVALVGRVQLLGLMPPGSRLGIGDYQLDFDGHDDTPTQLLGRVRDLKAPLLVRAQLLIRRDRSYALTGEVQTRPGAPPELSQAVAFLGAPDAAGRRTVEIGGTF